MEDSLAKPVAKKLHEVKRIFRLVVERKQLYEYPLQYVKLPKVQKQKIRIYSADEVDRILRLATKV